jgi:hypothetical protein
MSLPIKPEVGRPSLDAAPPEPSEEAQPVEVTDRATFCVYRLMAMIGRRESFRPEWAAGVPRADFQSRVVFHALGFAGAYAMFWLQNRNHRPNLTLYWICQSRAMTEVFVQMVEAVRRRDWKQLQARSLWFDSPDADASLLMDTPTQTEPLFIRADAPAGPSPIPAANLVQEAAGRGLRPVDAAALQERACVLVGVSSPAVLQTKLHAQIQLINLMGLLHRQGEGRIRKGRLEEEVNETVAWLRNFAAHGCACAT